MRIPTILLLCSVLVLCLTIFQPALGQDDGPPRTISPPRPTLTASGQGYVYTWCEYTPIMTCYDTTVTTAQRAMAGPQRVAVPVPESVDYFPLFSVILFSILSGLSNTMESSMSSSSGSASSDGGIVIVTTTPLG